MRIQIIDIGNTHTKFGDFVVSDGKVNLINFGQEVTPRENPKDLCDVIAAGVVTNPDVDVLMINSFSGAFIYDDKFYFADAAVPPFEYVDVMHEMDYFTTGQNHRFGLVGIPALLASVDSKSAYPPETPHGWVLRQLFGVLPHWELTHASRSGLYHLSERRWCQLPVELDTLPPTRQLLRCPVYASGRCVHTTQHGNLKVLAGGLDHSFVSSYHSGSYVASGTWCNIVRAEPYFNPKLDESKAGIRWGILADGRVAKELVFHVDSADARQFRAIREALPMLHFDASLPLTGGSAAKVRPMLEKKARLFYDLQGGFPHLEMQSAAYYAWRCAI